MAKEMMKKKTTIRDGNEDYDFDQIITKHNNYRPPIMTSRSLMTAFLSLE